MINRMLRILTVTGVLAFSAACADNTDTNEGATDMGNLIKINYVEFPVSDMNATKKFYSEAFGWTYVDYGPDYASFDNAGIDGGFDASKGRKPSSDGALVVMYAKDLEACLERVTKAGAEITKPIFSFPGGRRFEFLDPSGNALAVWSDPVEGDPAE